MNDAPFAEAMAHHQAGRVTDAAALYRAILERQPDHADSLHLLGLITADSGDPQGGIALIRRAMAVQPGCAPHYNSLGLAFRRLGQLDDAVTVYREAAALRPGSAEIQNNLATALCDLGRKQDAVEHYRQAAAMAPDVADIWYNLANVLADTGPPTEADACYRAAIRLAPNMAHARGNYGRWLMTQGRWADAEAQLSDALRLDPALAANWNNLGVVQRELGQPEAEACFRQALAADPNLADAHYNLGCLLFANGQTDAAIACHQAAMAADDAFGPARLAACVAQLPILCQSQDEVAARRQRYAEALSTLDPTGLQDAIGSSQPFFLPYQGQNDRALQAAYGNLACRALAEPAAPLASPPAQHERIRLGIVSAFFCDHTLFKLFLESWLTQFDRTRFEVIGFHTGRVADSLTDRCAAWSDRFVQGLPSAAAWRQAIIDAAPHVLLYPEVGIDPVAGRLAAQRLAPVQCVTWGHPETTGMPSIDAFLSSELMEPPEASAHYTERLVRLPNLGLCYAPDPLPLSRLERSSFGLDPEAPVFWSGQALYKYRPQHDDIFPRIAAALGRCQFVFIAFAKSHAVTKAFRQRLWHAFAAAGLDAASHVVILPPLSQADYAGAVGLADVILDTPDWSGGKSTLDCLAWDPAIVTWPGRFMRGRHTAAILQRIGCTETIAGSLDDYVSIAVRLARDPAWRAQIRQSVALGKHRVFNDTAYLRALEDFLADACRA
jgi:predicted O-linked N-acetylglucosamine transferase (SPINDLY family)